MRMSCECSKNRPKDFHYNLLNTKFQSEWEHFVLQDVKIHVFICNGSHLFARFLISATIIWLLLFFLFQQYCKRSSQPRQGNICESSFARCNVSTAPSSSSRGTAKHHRYNCPYGYKQLKCNIKDVTSTHCRKTAIMGYYNKRSYLQRSFL